MSTKLKVLAAALGVGVVVLVLMSPFQCVVYDAPAGYDPPGPECPQAPALIGFVWSNIYVGLVLAPAIALVATVWTARVLWRRYVPRRAPNDGNVA